MTYYVADFTGANPDYKVLTDVYTLTLSGVPISFNQPIYAASIVITPVGSTTPLLLDTDYAFETSDIDYTTMAKASNVNGQFKEALAKSVTITRPATQLPMQVIMSYQCFYLPTPTVPISNSAGSVNLSPDLIEAMLQDITVLKQQAAKVEQSAGFTDALPTIMQYDINETNPDNVVTNEVWSIDTYNNKNVIFPVQGPFFKDSVSLSIDGTPLVVGTDYLVLGVNLPLTRVTTNTSGIFNLILVTKPYAGQIQFGYHAVGGTVTANVIGSLYENLKAVTDFLSNSSFLTADSIGTSLVIQQMQNAIKELQKNMRTQLNGSPNYGDTTNGVTVAKNIRANNSGLHWFTIASLYKVTGTTVSYSTHDRMSLHVQLTTAGYMADIDVAFDQANTTYPMTATARNVVMDPGFVRGSTYNTTTVVYPAIRVIRNSDPSTLSGALLQIGLALPNLTETITIEDRSGVESTWLLDTNTGTAAAPLTPSDDGVLLPDGASTWSASGGMSVANTQTLANTTGFLAWTGTTLFSSFDNTNTNGPLVLNTILPSYLRTQDIKTFDVYFTDRNKTQYKVVMPVQSNAAGTGATGRQTLPISIAGSLGLLVITISNVANGSPNININILGTTIVADQLTLTDLIARM